MSYDDYINSRGFRGHPCQSDLLHIHKLTSQLLLLSIFNRNVVFMKLTFHLKLHIYVIKLIKE